MKFALIVCLALVAAATADIIIWSPCGTSTDILKIGWVKIIPNPPQAGKAIFVAGSGTFKSAVTSGVVVLNVNYEGTPLLTTNLTLCDVIKQFNPCPIPAGPQYLTITQMIPESVPQGTYDAQVNVYNQNGAQVTCVKGKVTF